MEEHKGVSHSDGELVGNDTVGRNGVKTSEENSYGSKQKLDVSTMAILNISLRHTEIQHSDTFPSCQQWLSAPIFKQHGNL
jgi:hypothetical protein